MTGPQSNQSTGPAVSRRDKRPLGILLMTIGMFSIGLLIAYYPGPRDLNRLRHDLFPPQPVVAMNNRSLPNPDPGMDTTAPDRQLVKTFSDDLLKQRLDIQFKRAVVMLHAKEYEHALLALQRVTAIAPVMPEAYVNSGYAMLGLERFEEAKQAFLFAIDLRPEQANAYYGLAVALDALDDRMGALGAMYSFIHRAKEDDPFRRKAAAAVWEWEAERNRDRSGEKGDGVQTDVTNQKG